MPAAGDPDYAAALRAYLLGAELTGEQAACLAAARAAAGGQLPLPADGAASDEAVDTHHNTPATPTAPPVSVPRRMRYDPPLSEMVRECERWPVRAVRDYRDEP